MSRAGIAGLAARRRARRARKRADRKRADRKRVAQLVAELDEYMTFDERLVHATPEEISDEIKARLWVWRGRKEREARKERDR